MSMRLVDRLAKDTRLGPGSMFIFNAFVQFVAFSLSCTLPKDKANSRNVYSRIEVTETGMEVY